MRLFNGSYVQIDTDSSIPAVGGMDAALVRTDNSRLVYEGPFGYGCVHTYDQHPRVDPRDPEDPADDRVIYVDGEGSEIAFDDPLQGGNGHAHEPGVVPRDARAHGAARLHADDQGQDGPALRADRANALAARVDRDGTRRSVGAGSLGRGRRSAGRRSLGSPKGFR